MCLTLRFEDPEAPDAAGLMEELSVVLAQLTGATGTASFGPHDVRAHNARFVVARDAQGRAVGCGAFRPLQPGIAEVKRMYARPGTAGVGTAVLRFLEAEAQALGYQVLRLETRKVNQRAVAFYECHGYRVVPNFGKYIGHAEAVCFAKRLSAE